MRMLVNACTWLADLAVARKWYQIWWTSHQLIASWYPYKENTSYKQQYVCKMLVHAFSVLLDSYDFQSTCNLALAGYFTVIILFLIFTNMHSFKFPWILIVYDINLPKRPTTWCISDVGTDTINSIKPRDTWTSTLQSVNNNKLFCNNMYIRLIG